MGQRRGMKAPMPPILLWVSGQSSEAGMGHVGSGSYVIIVPLFSLPGYQLALSSFDNQLGLGYHLPTDFGVWHTFGLPSGVWVLLGLWERVRGS